MTTRLRSTKAGLDDRWDAVVIGAGPAGAVAARQLALDRKRVLLVDKARFPREKVCGGCLGGAALDVLNSIGLGRLSEECGAITLGALVLASEGRTARIPIGRRAAVSRRTFDAALVKEAARAGAVVYDGAFAAVARPSADDLGRIMLKTDGGELTVHAKAIIIASGLGRAPAGHASLVSPASRIGLGAVLDQPPCEIAPGDLYMACSAVGYVGVTAVEGGRWDVAAAVDPHVLAAAESPGRLVDRILLEAGFLPVVDLEAVKWHGTPPLTRRTTPLASHRCLLIGDAAGYVEPFTGEGIGWAMYSAVLAASLLTGSLDPWDAAIPTRWQRLYHKALAGHQRSCRVVSGLLRVKPLRRIAVWGLRQAPLLSRPIVRRLDRPIAIQGRPAKQSTVHP